MKTLKEIYRLLLIANLLVLIILIYLVLATPDSSQALAEESQRAVLNTQIAMTCPSPPGEEPGAPPCVLPDDLDPQFVSPNPSGQAHLVVHDDDTAQINIQLEGLADDLVLTAWVAYFQPPGPIPHPIFEPHGEGLPPLASVAVPMAPTYAGFTEGLGQEPNQFTYNGDGRAHLMVALDYNPLKANQGPLRNGLVSTNQVAASVESGAHQPDCCPDGRPQAIGSSYLRRFDDQGFQLLDANGRPQLLRSPVPAAYLVVIAHIDKTTHGINAGNIIIPAPGIPASTGDHFTVGIFDLRQFHQE
jgi:hypothetical protein